MFKYVSPSLLLLTFLQAITTGIMLFALYLILYPSFFHFAYPGNASLNLLWLLFSTPILFEGFFLRSVFVSRQGDFLSLFKQRLGFDILIKATYLVVLIRLAPDISLLQVRLYYLFLMSIVLDAIKLYLLNLFFKGEPS